MKDLAHRIETRAAHVGVVGLGYVGLTLAVAFARAGFRVVGVDIKDDLVGGIAAGRCPLPHEPGLASLVRDVVSAKSLVVTTSFAPLAECDAILVNVETPVDEDHVPHFDALRAACRSVGQVMRPGALVIVESTLAPGTCGRVVAPTLAEASGRAPNEGFFLGHCPERVMPGKLLANLEAMPRVCGADRDEVRRAMVALYQTVVRARIDTTDLATAEIVKTAENAWRDVNIAFANELALVCESSSVDFDRVRELANLAPGRNVLAAGAGVGGPCIPKDSWLLVHGARHEPRLVVAARATNEGMPFHVAELVLEELSVAGVERSRARVTLLGVAYLENGASAAGTPTTPLAAYLRERGVTVTLHDPFVEPHTGDVWRVLDGAHAAVVVTAHDVYRDLDLGRLARTLAAGILVDGRRIFDPAAAARAGLSYRAVGRG